MASVSRKLMLERLTSKTPTALSASGAVFEGRPISTVRGMTGSTVFLRLSETELVLVEIQEIELARHPSGFTFLSRMQGDIVWGSDRYRQVSIDNRAVCHDKKWPKVTRFDDVKFGVPKSEWMIQFDRLRFRHVKAGKLRLLSIIEMDSKDLFTGLSLSQRIPPSGLLGSWFCPAVLTFDCINWACAGTCTWTGSGPIVGNCECNGAFGFCAWTPSGTRCINVDCSGTCINISGWAAYCICW